eukprot:CAMPEP_0170538756 /NCGR_PEP_ID=MMETSP0209-20121228/103507_1 /TAXON_ID=665100 ORGANISM="Litonotus pictus, Strain P1" /NCGR_SAMPLE_ID=MMETSP0209 /ASSEMBLY_ACC=CAM_ASM_000301 /LENGTH=257 /DNA_ID=CAMNT_0010840521 /DNA_START=2880 /DNA_END=3650 /DNA_ORIENTATION=+
MNNNFETFESSLLVLIRIMIGGKWNRIMREVGTELPGCIDHQKWEELIRDGPLTCGTYISYVFFISFFVMIGLLVMNLFVAVIVDCFINSSRSLLFIREKNLNQFFLVWNKYDRDLTFRIEAEEFIMLMIELSAPLGFTIEEYNKLSKRKNFKGKIFVSPDSNIVIDRINILQLAKSFNFKLQNGKVHLLDVVKLVTKRAVLTKKAVKEKSKNILTKNFLKLLERKFIEYDPTYLSRDSLKKLEKKLNKKELKNEVR